MKIEFKQKQTVELPLDNLEAAEFIFLATETSKQLGWTIGDITETGFVAYTNNGLFEWNAEIKMKINDGSAMLQSQSMGNGFKDVTGNKKNIQRFTSSFKDLKRQYYPTQKHQYMEI